MTYDDKRDLLAKDFLISMIQGKGHTFNPDNTIEQAFELADLFMKRVFPNTSGATNNG